MNLVLPHVLDTMNRRLTAPLRNVRAFLRRDAPLWNGLHALLVTDLAGFTSLVQRLGDRDGRALLRRHNSALRQCIEEHSGREAFHTGDGLLAAFRSVNAALDCAGAMQRALRRLSVQHPDSPLRARMGVHAGEPLPEEDRMFGHCVNVAIRVCAQASADTIFVTQVVTQLAEARFTFANGRPYTLKGMRDAATLYELAWEPNNMQRVSAM